MNSRKSQIIRNQVKKKFFLYNNVLCDFVPCVFRLYTVKFVAQYNNNNIICTFAIITINNITRDAYKKWQMYS